MSGSQLLISGDNQFSIRLAHARATIMSLGKVSSINVSNYSFTIDQKTNYSSEKLFIIWCEQLSEIKYNSVDIHVESYCLT